MESRAVVYACLKASYHFGCLVLEDRSIGGPARLVRIYYRMFTCNK